MASRKKKDDGKKPPGEGPPIHDSSGGLPPGEPPPPAEASDAGDDDGSFASRVAWLDERIDAKLKDFWESTLEPTIRELVTDVRTAMGKIPDPDKLADRIFDRVMGEAKKAQAEMASSASPTTELEQAAAAASAAAEAAPQPAQEAEEVERRPSTARIVKPAGSFDLDTLIDKGIPLLEKWMDRGKPPMDPITYGLNLMTTDPMRARVLGSILSDPDPWEERIPGFIAKIGADSYAQGLKAKSASAGAPDPPNPTAPPPEPSPHAGPGGGAGPSAETVPAGIQEQPPAADFTLLAQRAS